MLEETYEKFKLQLKSRKSSTEQLPEVVYTPDAQMHHICSYNHYRLKDSEIKTGQSHNDVYDNNELTHEFEYDLFEDIVKSKQLMADLKQIDEVEKTHKEREEGEFQYFPLEHFKDAGQIVNEQDPVLREARAAELFLLEQESLQLPISQKSSKEVSHVHNCNDEQNDEMYHHVQTINCSVYVPYNEEKQDILLPSTTELSRKENSKALYANENIDEWNADPYFDDEYTDTEMFLYAHYDGPKQVMVQAVYIGNYARILADIKGETYSMLNYNSDSYLDRIYDDTYTIPMYINNWYNGEYNANMVLRTGNLFAPFA